MNEQDVKMLENLTEEFAFMFEWIVENGKSEEEALEMIKAMPTQQERYMRVASNIDIAIEFFLEDLVKDHNWDNLSTTQKDKLLWDNGMNTRSHRFHERKALKRVPTPDGYKIVLKDIVYGQERLDREWIRSESSTSLYQYDYRPHYRASDEARTYAWGKRVNT